MVFQLGTADSSLAVPAALKVCKDVRGIDINMGCTQPFTTHSGMGSKLLETPHIAADILKSLRRELPHECSLSCKIRMRATLPETREFMQLCERSGADAVAVHLRTKDEDTSLKKGQPAKWSTMPELWHAVSIPVIANGDFLSREHISKFWADFGGNAGKGQESEAPTEDACSQGCNGVGRQGGPAAIMIARGALWDPSIFFRGPASEAPEAQDVVKSYIRTSVETNTTYDNTKWVLKEMLNCSSAGSSVFSRFLRGKPLRQLKTDVDKAMSMAELCGCFAENYNVDAYPAASHSLDYGRHALLRSAA